jgi:alanyl-tRNA synthetase
MKITSKEIRQKYLEFFKSKNHAIIESAPLVPENDPSVLFNTA